MMNYSPVSSSFCPQIEVEIALVFRMTAIGRVKVTHTHTHTLTHTLADE